MFLSTSASAYLTITIDDCLLSLASGAMGMGMLLQSAMYAAAVVLVCWHWHAEMWNAAFAWSVAWRGSRYELLSPLTTLSLVFMFTFTVTGILVLIYVYISLHLLFSQSRSRCASLLQLSSSSVSVPGFPTVKLRALLHSYLLSGSEKASTSTAIIENFNL